MYDYDVFLSFVSADAQIVRPLWQRLASSGLRVFWSDETLKASAGRSFVSGIQDALVRSQHFVLYWSSNAQSSSWVEEEYQAFYVQCYLRAKTERRLVVLCAAPALLTTLPPFLRQLQSASAIEDVVQLIGGVETHNSAREGPSMRVPESRTAGAAVPSTLPGPVDSLNEQSVAGRDQVIVRERSGRTHVFKSKIRLELGFQSGFTRECTVRRGTTLDKYAFDSMATVAMREEPGRVRVDFTLRQDPHEQLSGAIAVAPQYELDEPELYLETFDDQIVRLKLREIAWPITRGGDQSWCVPVGSGGSTTLTS